MKKLISVLLTSSMLVTSLPGGLVFGQSNIYKPDANYTTLRSDKTVMNTPAIMQARQQADDFNAYCGSPEHKADCGALFTMLDVMTYVNLKGDAPAYMLKPEQYTFKIPGNTEAEMMEYMASYFVMLYKRNQSFGIFGNAIVGVAPLVVNLVNLKEEDRQVYSTLLRQDVADTSVCYTANIADYPKGQRQCEAKTASIVALAQISKGRSDEAAARAAIQAAAFRSITESSSMSQVVSTISITALMGLDAQAEVGNVLNYAAKKETEKGNILHRTGVLMDALFNPKTIGQNIKNLVLGQKPYKSGPVSTAGAYIDASGPIKFEGNVWEDMGKLLGQDKNFQAVLRDHILKNIEVSKNPNSGAIEMTSTTLNPLIVGALSSGNVDLSTNELNNFAKEVGTTPNGLILSMFYDQHGMDAVSINELKKRVYKAYQLEVKKNPAIIRLEPPSYAPSKGAEIANKVWNYTTFGLGVLDVALTIYFTVDMVKGIATLPNKLEMITQMIRTFGTKSMSTLNALKNAPEILAKLRSIKAARVAEVPVETAKAGSMAGKTAKATKGIKEADLGGDLSKGLGDLTPGAGGKGAGVSDIGTAEKNGGAVVNKTSAPKVNDGATKPIGEPQTQVTVKNTEAALNKAIADENKAAAGVENAKSLEQQLSSKPSLTKAEQQLLAKTRRDIPTLEGMQKKAQINREAMQSNVDKLNALAKPPQAIPAVAPEDGLWVKTKETLGGAWDKTKAAALDIKDRITAVSRAQQQALANPGLTGMSMDKVYAEYDAVKAERLAKDLNVSEETAAKVLSSESSRAESLQEINKSMQVKNLASAKEAAINKILNESSPEFVSKVKSDIALLDKAMEERRATEALLDKEIYSKSTDEVKALTNDRSFSDRMWNLMHGENTLAYRSDITGLNSDLINNYWAPLSDSRMERIAEIDKDVASSVRGNSYALYSQEERALVSEFDKKYQEYLDYFGKSWEKRQAFIDKNNNYLWKPRPIGEQAADAKTAATGTTAKGSTLAKDSKIAADAKAESQTAQIVSELGNSRQIAGAASQEMVDAAKAVAKFKEPEMTAGLQVMHRRIGSITDELHYLKSKLPEGVFQNSDFMRLEDSGTELNRIQGLINEFSDKLNPNTIGHASDDLSSLGHQMQGFTEAVGKGGVTKQEQLTQLNAMNSKLQNIENAVQSYKSSLKDIDQLRAAQSKMSNVLDDINPRRMQASLEQLYGNPGIDRAAFSRSEELLGQLRKTQGELNDIFQHFDADKLSNSLGDVNRMEGQLGQIRSSIESAQRSIAGGGGKLSVLETPENGLLDKTKNYLTDQYDKLRAVNRAQQDAIKNPGFFGGLTKGKVDAAYAQIKSEREMQAAIEVASKNVKAEHQAWLLKNKAKIEADYQEIRAQMEAGKLPGNKPIEKIITKKPTGYEDLPYSLPAEPKPVSPQKPVDTKGPLPRSEPAEPSKIYIVKDETYRPNEYISDRPVQSGYSYIDIVTPVGGNEGIAYFVEPIDSENVFVVPVSDYASGEPAYHGGEETLESWQEQLDEMNAEIVHHYSEHPF